ncbi:nitrous oxide reductase accessory protein NosL [Sulfurimonas sp. HSL-1716]|uniref:nitrous oxide reductase accessory protein NosL n=1 Tax=Hydrocurvibacter sulfurireducens TaxID=3131937 RepID=UPI0031FA1855
MKKLVMGILILSSFVFVPLLSANDLYTLKFDRNTIGFIRKVKVYKAPEWVAKINLSSGKELYFCSPKSMFEFYDRPAKWPYLNVKSESDFKAIVVTDFATLKPIDAKKAFFVYGSNVISPAGDDLPAFASYEDAQKFAKKHHAARVFKFDKVAPGLIRLLNGDI